MKKNDLFVILLETEIVGTLYNCLIKAVLKGTHYLCFIAEIRKIIYTPANPIFYIKAGFEKIKITQTYFHDDS